jgi:hypothetical protein
MRAGNGNDDRIFSYLEPPQAMLNSCGVHRPAGSGLGDNLLQLLHSHRLVRLVLEKPHLLSFRDISYRTHEGDNPATSRQPYGIKATLRGKRLIE